ncbi:MAG: hypothetical protein AAGI38_04570 [Bacteroidota bacterium]
MKKLIIHGVVASILASISGIIYAEIYANAMWSDFSAVINPTSIIAASTIGCLLMTLGYFVLIRFNKEKFIGFLNIVISVLSFASIVGPLGMSLPLDIESPELFPGLSIPMHFFPALAFFTVAPFFQVNQEQVSG